MKLCYNLAARSEIMKKLKKNLPEGVKYEFARYKGVKVKLVPNKKKSTKTK